MCTYLTNKNTKVLMHKQQNAFFLILFIEGKEVCRNVPLEKGENCVSSYLVTWLQTWRNARQIVTRGDSSKILFQHVQNLSSHLMVSVLPSIITVFYFHVFMNNEKWLDLTSEDSEWTELQKFAGPQICQSLHWSAPQDSQC